MCSKKVRVGFSLAAKSEGQGTRESFNFRSFSPLINTMRDTLTVDSSHKDDRAATPLQITQMEGLIEIHGTMKRGGPYGSDRIRIRSTDDVHNTGMGAQEAF